MQANGNSIIEFLTELFNSGLSYSSINSAKAAVVTFISMSTGRKFDKELVLFNKFMQGVFSLRPALPKYANTWDVSLVLKFLKGQSPPDALTTLALSRKLATLLLLLSGQRGQTMHSVHMKNVTCSDDMLIIRFGELLKTSGPGRHLGEITLPAYTREPGLCVVRTYQAYLARTRRYRKGKGLLFLQTLKPFSPIKRSTFGKWIRATLMLAGVDMTVFAPHSSRGAATSAANAKGVPIGTILKTAGWASECTFRKFYDRPVNRDVNFAKSVLSTLDDTED